MRDAVLENATGRAGLTGALNAWKDAKLPDKIREIQENVERGQKELAEGLEKFAEGLRSLRG